MRAPDVVDLCRDLVRIPSVGDEHGEVAVVQHLVDLLDGVPGARCDIHIPAPGRSNLICTIDSEVPGPTLILNGHTDTVPAGGEGWTRDPYSGDIAAGQLWGRGSCDMKGGLAALTAASLELVERGGPAAGRILLTATADEDGAGLWGLPWLVREGLLHGDAAIVAEPAGVGADFEHVYIATRGSTRVRVEVRTPHPGHSSAYTPDQPHAVAVACRLQQALENGFRPEPVSHPAFAVGPTVVAGEIFRGGHAVHFLPEEAHFIVSCRPLPGATRDGFLRQIRDFVADVAQDVDVRVEFDADSEPWGPPMALSDQHSLATAALGAVHRAGYPEAELSGWPAFSEAAFLAAQGIPTLPGLGPGRLDLAHRPDEHVSVRALRAAVGIYLDLFDVVLQVESILPHTRDLRDRP